MPERTLHATIGSSIERSCEIYKPSYSDFTRGGMTMADGNFVAYYRTSTRTQDLGIEAQKAAVLSWLNGGKHKVIGEFEEHESGKNDERAQLQAAIALCKKRKATLVIAKMDRLSRDLA